MSEEGCGSSVPSNWFQFPCMCQSVHIPSSGVQFECLKIYLLHTDALSKTVTEFIWCSFNGGGGATALSSIASRKTGSVRLV